MSKAFYCELPTRGLIHIEGEDRLEFLQGLVSNDVQKLEFEKILYACLFTPHGKYLHDFFMLWGDDFILIDCEGGERCEDLYTRLNRYRLRSKVTLSFELHNKVYACWNSEHGLRDPRHESLGNRTFEKPGSEEKPFEYWDDIRIKACTPDGTRDMIPEKSLPLDYRLDQLNALDWDKGCYMGQELNARMHHRHLGKKHLQALEFDETLPEPFSDLIFDDKKIGQMHTSYGTIGLALIRDEYLDDIQTGKYPLRLLGQ
ncbi:MAG: folate-binding protein [Pseudomonadota bacterium]